MENILTVIWGDLPLKTDDSTQQHQFDIHQEQIPKRWLFALNLYNID